MVETIWLDFPIKSGILAPQSRDRSGNPGHWLHFLMVAEKEGWETGKGKSVDAPQRPFCRGSKTKKRGILKWMPRDVI
ncbi:MAG: hypothetical protein ABSE97_08500 [Verrucomicrobiota bacterium]